MTPINNNQMSEQELVEKIMREFSNRFVIATSNGAFIKQGVSVKEIKDFIRDSTITLISHERAEAVTGETSDGYHTFNELYEFRKLYNAALFNEWAKQGKFKVHKSLKHSDGELCFGGGWFIVTAELPTGQISNHYEVKDWDLFGIPDVPVAHAWDGHTPQDVAKRLKEYLKTKEEV